MQVARRLPIEPGFYWAKSNVPWGMPTKSADVRECNWEVVQVYVDGLHEGEDDYLMVLMAGVEKPSSLSDFSWGSGPLMLNDAIAAADASPVMPYPLDSADK